MLPITDMTDKPQNLPKFTLAVSCHLLNIYTQFEMLKTNLEKPTGYKNKLQYNIILSFFERAYKNRIYIVHIIKTNNQSLNPMTAIDLNHFGHEIASRIQEKIYNTHKGVRPSDAYMHQ